ncbi:MAG: histidine kinase, partial [Oscillospiraceae bacterium]
MKKYIDRLVLILPLTLIVIVFICVIVYKNFNYQTVKKQVYAILHDSANEQSTTLKVTLEGQYSILETFANSLASQEDYDIDDVIRRMGAIQDASSFIYVGVANVNGNLYSSDGRMINVRDRDYFQQALIGQRAIEKLPIERLDLKPRFVIAVPIQKDDKILGAVIGSYEEKEVNKLLVPEVFNKTGYSFLCKQNGDIIIGANNPVSLLNGQNVLDFLKMSKLEDISYEDFEKHLKNNDNGIINYEYKGQIRYAVYQPIGLNDWYIFNVIPMEVVKNLTKENTINFLIMMTVVLGCSIGIFIFILYREKITAEKFETQRVDIMLSQIKPHFLYNTLSTIRTQINSCPEVASNLIYDFSKYLRNNIDVLSNDELISFSKELETIKIYCEMEKIRFGNRVNVIFDISEADFLVPPLSIQPFIENAIKHGVSQKLEGGTVWIGSSEHENKYIIVIKDDGVGFDINVNKKKKSVGMTNSLYRISKMTKGKININSTIGI